MMAFLAGPVTDFGLFDRRGLRWPAKSDFSECQTKRMTVEGIVSQERVG